MIRMLIDLNIARITDKENISLQQVAHVSSVLGEGGNGWRARRGGRLIGGSMRREGGELDGEEDSDPR